MHVLIIGGTRFIGRHTVEEFLVNDYKVTLFNRGNHPNPFAQEPEVNHVNGDRTNQKQVERLGDREDPDIIVDFVAYRPADVSNILNTFPDVHKYVYVSAGDVYADTQIPLREGDANLELCTKEDAQDTSMATHSARKAEGDRVVFEAAERGINATSIRPFKVYGPHDYEPEFVYWINRVSNYDRVVVPGDGGSVLHSVYVEDVARAVRLVTEEGQPGEAYNVAGRHAMTLEEIINRIADSLNKSVQVIHLSEHDLALGELHPGDFPLYVSRPTVAATAKLASLGWESTPQQRAIDRTVDDVRTNGRSTTDIGPERDAVENIISAMGG